MDTIVALATPPGRSGVGVIRISGSNSFVIAEKLIQQRFNPKNRRDIVLRRLLDPGSNEQIDEALITSFVSPNSFTGEDVVEISCHGSPIVLRRVLDICLSLEARLAEPGEFTLRALANGRLDLSQAEAIRDLIDAKSIAMSRQAIRQLSGELSHELQPLKSDLLDLVVILESALEFVEDDLPEAEIGAIDKRLRTMSGRVEHLAETYKAGKIVREGIRVALVGRPNVGKSSLFNRLVGMEQAIVTDIPGTTRDQLHQEISINGIAVSLFDTAGLRETEDQVEKIGVERSRRALVDADLVLVLLDSTSPLLAEDIDILKSVEQLNFLIISNKSDLVTGINLDGFEFLSVSAKTGDGIEELRNAIGAAFSASELENGGFLISDARHRDLLISCKKEIDESIEHLNSGASEEITLIGLHNALRFLGEITGETTTEDMLTRIFSTFCIGK